VTFGPGKGFVVSSFIAAGSPQAFGSDTGEAFVSLLDSGGNAGSEMTSVAFISPQNRFICFTLDGAATKKRATFAIPRAPIRNFIEVTDVSSYAAEFPPVITGGESVQSVSVVRYLPFAEEVFVGGFNRFAVSPSSNLAFEATEVCEDPTDCITEINSQLAMVNNRQALPPAPGGGGGGDPPSNNLNQTGGLITTYGAASPHVVVRNTFAENTGLVNGTIYINTTQILSVTNELVVLNPLTFLKQLGSIESVGGSIVLSNTASVRTETNMYLGASALTVGIDSVISINQNLVIESDSTLRIDLSSNFPFNVSFINITVANYSQVLGQFGTVLFIQPNQRSVISSVNGSTCTATVGAPQTTYGASTLTVTASVTNECAETRGSGMKLKTRV
jgi:hypothetical protein